MSSALTLVFTVLSSSQLVIRVLFVNEILQLGFWYLLNRSHVEINGVGHISLELRTDWFLHFLLLVLAPAWTSLVCQTTFSAPATISELLTVTAAEKLVDPCKNSLCGGCGLFVIFVWLHSFSLLWTEYWSVLKYFSRVGFYNNHKLTVYC
jgi:hypothetical protein